LTKTKKNKKKRKKTKKRKKETAGNGFFLVENLSEEKIEMRKREKV